MLGTFGYNLFLVRCSTFREYFWIKSEKILKTQTLWFIYNTTNNFSWTSYNLHINSLYIWQIDSSRSITYTTHPSINKELLSKRNLKFKRVCNLRKKIDEELSRVKKEIKFKNRCQGHRRWFVKCRWSLCKINWITDVVEITFEYMI